MRRARPPSYWTLIRSRLSLRSIRQSSCRGTVPGTRPVPAGSGRQDRPGPRLLVAVEGATVFFALRRRLAATPGARRKQIRSRDAARPCLPAWTQSQRASRTFGTRPRRTREHNRVSRGRTRRRRDPCAASGRPRSLRHDYRVVGPSWPDDMAPVVRTGIPSHQGSYRNILVAATPAATMEPASNAAMPLRMRDVRRDPDHSPRSRPPPRPVRSPAGL